ncbi:universal stress protein [Halobacteria archaeon AArc-m2/3/4]|uniref:Universal stress protein n=1 Tax=Natronoglomus mannanivorans TaxID=2979990 RepID=A0AAP2YYW6_9EURY|nr:universal stress protein [Halobacteria archaeon AArc-xg1-1]MCU4971211.1 universal stress protein [Halobacteria archaeon AArc-m2/3/4]
MYTRILLPTDGSETTDRALEHALDLATQYDAELHVLYVVDATVFANDVETGAIVEEFETMGNRIVDHVIQQATDAGIEPTRTSVVRGTPHKRILEYTDENEIDLVVMGTHGRSGLDRYLLGSVTEKVVRLSDAPVLTVRESSS